MNKPLALFWGVLTLSPFIFMFYFMSVFMADMPMTPGDFAENKATFDRFFRMGMVFNGSVFLLVASYIVYLFRTEHVPKGKKALWAVALFMGHVISMPIFWFIYVWSPIQKRKDDSDSAT